MIFGCQDHVNVLGRKITAVLHQNPLKDILSSSPTLDINGNYIFLSIMIPMTKFNDVTLKEYLNSENGEVVKFLKPMNRLMGGPTLIYFW